MTGRRQDDPPADDRKPMAAVALDELYRQSEGRVRGLCLRLLHSPEEAEDAASEAFLKAQRARGSYDPSRPFANWILTIAGRVCLDRLRRRSVERRIFTVVPGGAGETPDGGPGPLARLLAGETRRRVRRLIAGLPERHRQVLVLRYYGELSYEEIAGLLGLKRNHVAVLLFRAKQRLRRALELQPRPGPERTDRSRPETSS